jgi:hypothetical protein
MNSNAKFTSGLSNKSPIPMEIAEIANGSTVANVKPVLNLPSPILDGLKTFERVKK